MNLLLHTEARLSNLKTPRNEPNLLSTICYNKHVNLFENLH